MLIVEDDADIRRVMEMHFGAVGLDVHSTPSGRQAIEHCQTALCDVVLLDLRLPDLDGLAVLEQIKHESPETVVILFTAHGNVETAVKAMKLGAEQFLLKPVDLQALEVLIGRNLEGSRRRSEVRYLKAKVSRLAGSGRAPKLRFPKEISATIELISRTNSTVLILGDTGTGKGMAAGLIHELSERRAHPFVEINCAGLNPTFLESELFGHQKGAFTDAAFTKPGLLETAHRGTLLLDEVAELTLPVQAKLLKVLEDQVFRRLGGTRNIAVDVRLITATNADLQQRVSQGRFRKDLFYRLNVMPLRLPPLADRQEDILPLAHDILEQLTRETPKRIGGLSAAAEQLLLRYPWPGNIRELRNIMERAILLCEGDTILPRHLPASLAGRGPAGDPSAQPDLALEDDLSLEAAERAHLLRVLSLCDHNRSQAAKLLGIHRSTLLQKIRQYQLPAAPTKPPKGR